MSADDPVLASCKDMTVASLQPEEDKMVAWSDKGRFTLNSSKCKTEFFSLHCAKAAWQPNITIDGKLMPCNPFQIFMGVR